jgi:hypothetical protein
MNASGDLWMAFLTLSLRLSLFLRYEVRLFILSSSSFSSLYFLLYSERHFKQMLLLDLNLVSDLETPHSRHLFGSFFLDLETSTRSHFEQTHRSGYLCFTNSIDPHVQDSGFFKLAINQISDPKHGQKETPT